jgi:hypothetical protein
MTTPHKPKNSDTPQVLRTPPKKPDLKGPGGLAAPRDPVGGPPGVEPHGKPPGSEPKD